MFRRLCLAAVCVLCGLSTPISARADDYPIRTVRIVVPFAAGGGLDLMARILAQQLAIQTGYSFVVENKAGASGLVGLGAVSSSRPDGYTLLFSSSAVATLPFLTPDMRVDVERDLTPVSLVTTSPAIMAINASIPAKTPTELVAWINEHPDEFRWGSGGIASNDHLAILQFNKIAGVAPLVVPYSGVGPVAIAVASGEVGGLIIPAPALKPYLDSGKIRALGVASPEPSPLVPGLPTVVSFGFPNFQYVTWYGVWGPKGMPPELADKIHQEIAKALTARDLIDKFHAQGNEPTGSQSPAEFAAFFKDQLDKYRPLVEEVLKQDPK